MLAGRRTVASLTKTINNTQAEIGYVDSKTGDEAGCTLAVRWLYAGCTLAVR